MNSSDGIVWATHGRLRLCQVVSLCFEVMASTYEQRYLVMFREFSSNETVPAKSGEFGTAKPETPTTRVRHVLLRSQVQEDGANRSKARRIVLFLV